MPRERCFADNRPGPAGFRASVAPVESPESVALVRDAVRLAQHGDREAMRFLYVRYANNIYGYVRSIVRADDEAEDVTQQVFVKLMVSVGKYDDRGVPFFGWLLRMAHNVAIDHMRANRPRSAAGVIEPVMSHDPGLGRLYSIREALEALPSAQREVVILKDLLGLSAKEIAAHMHRTESSIHGLHHRATRFLQRQLVALESAPVTRTKRELAAA